MIELLAATLLFAQTPTLEDRLHYSYSCGYYADVVVSTFSDLPVRTASQRRDRDYIVQLADRVGRAAGRQGMAIMDQMTEDAITALDFPAWDARLNRAYGRGELDAETVGSLGVLIRGCADYLGVSV